MSALPPHPELYRPELESIDDDEAQMEQELTKAMLSVSRKVYEDSHHAMRSVHAKSHGLLKAQVEVLENLPEPLAQGVFSTVRRYDALIRLSTNPGDILPDRVSTPRGLAIKLLDVHGTRLPDNEDGHDQDFVLVNGKKFSAPNAKAFLANLKLLAATTDRAEGAKAALSGALRGVERLIEKTGHQSAVAKALGGEPETNILGESFFSQLPLRHGRHIAKLALVPASANLKALTGQKLDIGQDDNAIRSAVQHFFTTETAEWHLQVQLCADAEAMPIENGVVQWDEKISPFVTVARVLAHPQAAWTEQRSKAVDDGIGFSPWHGIIDHQPLGSLMRLRKLAYKRVQQFRSERNPTPVQPLNALDAIPD